MVMSNPFTADPTKRNYRTIRACAARVGQRAGGRYTSGIDQAQRI
jgi:hypothetical protein